MPALAVLVSCGPPKPAVTVPAPMAKPEVSAAAPKPDGLIPPQPTLRLPRSFLPTGYTARLELDPAATGFAGSIQIVGTINERSRAIWLNAHKLAITSAVARREGQADVALTATAAGEDFLELRAPVALDAGPWTIAIDYTGAYDALATSGVFQQKVGDQAYVFSQLEAVYARRAFPCFDEPDNKVPWQLTLDVPKAMVAVANAPEKTSTPLGDGKKRVEFEPTRPLPSYLVAFAVGPFELVDAGKTAHGTPVRIVALAHRAADAAFAAKTSAKLIDYLEDYFGIPYPYPKIDMVAIPLTVGFGAMENAGMITYAETLVLMDGKASKERQERWISVGSHELAHQWFGDLVTMDFWNDIWLNEGFASWVQNKINQRFAPDWHADQNQLTQRETALDHDSQVTARQIRQPIKVMDDIYTAFDRITYEKGASILNMFEAYIGAELFQHGIRDYLQAHAWGNATSADFVAAISKAAGKDIGPAFATFLEQAGTPEITATPSCHEGKTTVALHQQHYLPPGAGASAKTEPWIVPVCVAFDNAGKRAETCTLLDQPDGSLALDTKACPRWLMPNVNGRGYYRSAYTAAEVIALRDEAWPLLSWTERRALFHDVHDAASTGALPLTLALSMVPKLLAGNDRFTVQPAVQLAGELRRIVPAELRPRYEAWLRQTFTPGAAKAGFVPRTSDSLDTEVTRGLLIQAAAWQGRDPRLVADAVRLADRWRDLPQGVRGSVLDLAVDASPAVFDRVRKEVMTEQDRTRRTEMLHALGSVRDAARQQQALLLVIDPKLDARETINLLFGAAGRGRRIDGGALDDASLAVAQQFFRDHQAQIMKSIPEDGTAGAASTIGALFTQTCRADQRDAITAYVQQTFGSLPGGARTVAQFLEEMDLCIARRTTLEPQVRGWLTGLKIKKSR
ncbi:MAG TPA: M1 family metallopeptidase [Kofleriaceae bacterium]